MTKRLLMCLFLVLVVPFNLMACDNINKDMVHDRLNQEEGKISFTNNYFEEMIQFEVSTSFNTLTIHSTIEFTESMISQFEEITGVTSVFKSSRYTVFIIKGKLFVWNGIKDNVMDIISSNHPVLHMITIKSNGS